MTIKYDNGGKKKGGRTKMAHEGKWKDYTDTDDDDEIASIHIPLSNRTHTTGWWLRKTKQSNHAHYFKSWIDAFIYATLCTFSIIIF